MNVGRGGPLLVNEMPVHLQTSPGTEGLSDHLTGVRSTDWSNSGTTGRPFTLDCSGMSRGTLIYAIISGLRSVLSCFS